jgi:ketosteroid isomerase-like protein
MHQNVTDLNANPLAPVDMPEQHLDTRAVVTEFLRRTGEGDPERIAELFAERFDWRLAWPVEGNPGAPWNLARSTRADVAEHFRTLDAYHVPEKREASLARFLVDGTDAVVLGEIAQTVRATGRSYRSPVALHFTVEDGLITRYHVYEDSLTIARALATEG